MPITRKSLAFMVVSAFTSAVLLAACGGGGGDPTGDPPKTISSISLSPSSTAPMQSLGETRSVVAVGADAAGAPVTLTAVTWSSSAPAVASVSGSSGLGTVTAVGNGTATIKAVSGGVESTVSITVTQKATAVAVSGVPATLAPGTTAQLTGEAIDARSRSVPGVTGVVLSSSNEAVAVVNAAGVVTAIAPGAAQISGTVTVAGTVLTGSSQVVVSFGTSNPAAATVQATDGNQFTPPTVSIATGGTVTWSFANVLHNVTFGGGAGAPSGIPNTASTQVTRTFPTAGAFNYDCTLHPGMTGTVVVQNSSNVPSFVALLNGANERPTAVTTNGAGAASFFVNGTTVTYSVTFARLSGAPSMAHIHGPGNATQAVGVLVNFPTTGQTLNNGVLTGTFNASNIQNAGISLDSLLVLMRNGNAYVNVHTAQNSAGEIRGQLLVPQ